MEPTSHSLFTGDAKPTPPLPILCMLPLCPNSVTVQLIMCGRRCVCVTNTFFDVAYSDQVIELLLHSYLPEFQIGRPRPPTPMVFYGHGCDRKVVGGRGLVKKENVLLFDNQIVRLLLFTLFS